MQQRKKCERCNTLNDPDRIYCVNCGKYLRGKVTKREDKVTIWGIDSSPVRNNSDKRNVPAAKQVIAKQVVICPECASVCDAVNGGLPISCSVCGYYFQAGIDKIIGSADLDRKMNKTDHAADADKTQSDNSKPTAKSQGPLRRARKDTTSLRIISITSNHILPEMMNLAGNVIGMNGTVLKAFKSDQQISIWHTDAGWYVRATIGTPLVNGVPMNQGVQMKLFAGDLIVIDREQFMVEIF